MRDVRNRQLPLLVVALFCAAAAALSAPPKVEDTSGKRLLKLKMDGVALTARNAGLEDWRKLGAEYSALAERHPKNAAIRDAYGNFLWGTNDHDGALREWLDGVHIEPKNAEILNHLGGAYMTQGEPKVALGFYLRAADAAPENARTHFAVANIACLFRRDVGRTEDECYSLALRHFAEAHRLAPQSSEFARAYAETFYLIPHPDWQTALKVWQHYLKLSQEKDFALLNLARVHMKLGDAENARACLAQVIDPKNDRLKTRLAARIDAELSSEKGADSPKTEKTSKPVIDEAPPVP